MTQHWHEVGRDNGKALIHRTIESPRFGDDQFIVCEEWAYEASEDDLDAMLADPTTVVYPGVHGTRSCTYCGNNITGAKCHACGATN